MTSPGDERFDELLAFAHSDREAVKDVAPHRDGAVFRSDAAPQGKYGRGMLPIILAYPLALIPFASLAGALVWMARSAERGETLAA